MFNQKFYGKKNKELKLKDGRLRTRLYIRNVMQWDKKKKFQQPRWNLYSNNNNKRKSFEKRSFLYIEVCCILYVQNVHIYLCLW